MSAKLSARVESQRAVMRVEKAVLLGRLVSYMITHTHCYMSVSQNREPPGDPPETYIFL